jgi:N-acyl-D-amino-acid deacylase
VFDPSTVIDRATYQQPHRFCGGVHHVFIDGTEVIREGIDTGALTGAVLCRQGEGFARRGR